MGKISEIVKLDDRGRVVVPGSIRKVMRLVSGTDLMMIADDTKNEIKLIPFLGKDVKPIRITLTMKDVQGALAKIAAVIDELGINLLYEEAHIIKKGEQAEWIAIGDIETMEKERTFNEIKDAILESGVVEEVSIDSY